MASPSRTTWKDWIPVVTAAAVLVGALLAVGGYIAQVKDHERRLVVLEQKRDSVDDKLQVIDVRTARIEGKIETLLPADKKATAP